MAACVVCNLPVVTPAFLPSGAICHMRCRAEAQRRERQQEAEAESTAPPPSHPAIRKP